MARRPLVIAHRGFSARYPENTVEAALGAIQFGADLVEVDVQETVDGEVVVFHDFRLQRLCGMKGSVSRTSYSQLRKCKSDLPTLATMLNAVHGKCRLLIEMKRVNPVKVARVIEETGMEQQVIVFAFNVPLLKQLAQVNSRIPRFGLIGERTSEALREIRRAVDVSGIGISNRLLRSKADVRRLQQQLGPVFVWTVNRAARMRTLADWGVDGIITNYPDRMLAISSAGR